MHDRTVPRMRSLPTDRPTDRRGGPSSAEGFPRPEALGPVEVHPPGSALFRQGHQPQTVSLLLSGLVKKIRGDASGAEVIVGLRGPDWPLGASAAVVDRAFVSSAVAIVPCKVRTIPASTFAQLCASDIDVAAWHERKQAYAMREQEERWAELAICSAGERLRRTLGRLRHLLRPPVRGDCFALALPFAQRDLARACRPLA